MTVTALQQSLVTAPVSDEGRRLAALEASVAATAAQGVVTMAADQTSGVVSGLGLAFTPVHGELSMQVPAGGLGITVVLIGAPTADGFSWRTLNGVPDSDSYKFSYRLS